MLSVYNKWMFSPDRFGFPSPLFVTTLHMGVQFLLAALLRTFWPLLFRPTHNPNRSDYLYVVTTRYVECADFATPEGCEPDLCRL